MGKQWRALRFGVGLLWACGWVLGASATATGQQQITLAGSGSSLAGPLLGVWGRKFHERQPAIQVGYIATSSSEGIAEVSRLAGDFAIGELPLTEKQRNDRGAPLAEIPVAVFSIVPVYRLSGRSQIRFTGELLAQIYMGHITNWRDPRIARLNPDAVLPDLPITVLQRPEGTGSRYVFTEFLVNTSPEFRNWNRRGDHELPGEVMAVRSKGVADKLASTAGAIGFVEYDVAIEFGLQYGLVENAAGKYVAPSRQSIDGAAAAMQEMVLSESPRPLINAPGEGSYPMTSFAWVYVNAHMPEERKRDLYEFLQWCLGEGQDLIPGQGHDRLPRSVATKAQARLAALLRR